MLEQLAPQTVFHWFEKVCAIPRGSGRMEAISRWCMDFAQQRGLPCRRDAVGNVVITKPGQGAMAACAPLILQGHMDMVCAATPQAEVDLTCCGPQLQTDGTFVWARETTLGADDGIAVAMILAVLDDDRMVHPPLEAVLTVDEEAGMQGAKALDKSLLHGRRMINLDAERAGEIFAGCAGGNGMTFSLPVMRETFDGDAWQLEIGGLRGGHSGVDIHKGRACALTLLGRVLDNLDTVGGVRVIWAEGGQADNAIADTAAARIQTVPGTDVTAVIDRMEKELRQEYRVTEPELYVHITPAHVQEPAMDAVSTRRLLCLLQCAPQGVMEMSMDVPGLPQTSCNLGVLRTSQNQVTGEFCIRSALDTQQEMMNRRISALVQVLGGHVTVRPGCPGWEFVPESPLRECCCRAWQETTGSAAVVKISHAGAECGLFAAAMPGLDAVAMGPTITDVHTPRERLDAASVDTVWRCLCRVLELLAAEGC